MAAQTVTLEGQSIASLRSRVSRLRNELASTTEAYRKATANRDSQQAIPLLRNRSLLMRQLLESQCELLLALRTEPESELLIVNTDPVLTAAPSAANRL